MSTVTDPIDSDDGCPGCGATDGVQPPARPADGPGVDVHGVRPGLDGTVVNPTLRVALSSVGLLPTPQLHTVALLDVLRTEVTQRSEKEYPAPKTRPAVG